MSTMKTRSSCEKRAKLKESNRTASASVPASSTNKRKLAEDAGLSTKKLKHIQSAAMIAGVGRSSPRKKAGHSPLADSVKEMNSCPKHKYRQDDSRPPKQSKLRKKATQSSPFIDTSQVPVDMQAHNAQLQCHSEDRNSNRKIVNPRDEQRSALTNRSPLTHDLIDASNILALVKLGNKLTAEPKRNDVVDIERTPENGVEEDREPAENLTTSQYKSLMTLRKATEAISDANRVAKVAAAAPLVQTVPVNTAKEKSKVRNGTNKFRRRRLPIGAAAQRLAAGAPNLLSRSQLQEAHTDDPKYKTRNDHERGTTQGAKEETIPIKKPSPIRTRRSPKSLHHLAAIVTEPKLSGADRCSYPKVLPGVLQVGGYSGYALPPPYPPQCLYCHSGYYPILNHPHYYAGSVLPPPPFRLPQIPTPLQEPIVASSKCTTKPHFREPIVELSTRKVKPTSPTVHSVDETNDEVDAVNNGTPPNGLPPEETAAIELSTATKRTSKSRFKRWTTEEDQKLLEACEENPSLREHNWCKISVEVFGGGRSAVQCKSRWHNMIRPGRKVGGWTKEEDSLIIQLKAEGRTWNQIADRLPDRRMNHIRERYITSLDPSNNFGPWTDEEMKILIDAQQTIGNKWMEIAKLLPGRSVAAVKNRFYNVQTSKHREGRRLAVETLMKWDWQKRRKAQVDKSKQQATAPTPSGEKAATTTTTPCTDSEHCESCSPENPILILAEENRNSKEDSDQITDQAKPPNDSSATTSGIGLLEDGTISVVV